MTATTEVPLASFDDVALIDAEKAAAVGGMSVSRWHAEVATGRAPKPAVRKPRCSRWRWTAVRSVWQLFAEQGSDETAAAVIAHATKASRAAQTKRTAPRAGVVRQ